MKRESHKLYDTMGFWEDGTGKLETRFRLLIFNIFSLRRTFQSIGLHLALSCELKRTRCVRIEARVSASGPGARFSKDPITYWVRKAIFNYLYLKKKQCIGIKLCMEVKFVCIKIA